MKQSTGYLLAIETSCDETAAAVVQFDAKKITILSNIVASQIALHRKTFGVIPEIASRAHTEKIIGVIEQALDGARITINQIAAVAVTTGPGLIGSLFVGAETAKTIAYAKCIPIVPVNHLEGHIFSAFAEKIQNSSASWRTNIKKSFPALALIVSGGHTELVLIKKLLNYEIVGQTMDDAAGEAFDKIARLLGLPYPGGPAIAAEAAKHRIKNNELRIKLPRPMLNAKNFDLSFSGLKTAVLYYLKKHPTTNKSMMAYEVQEAIVDVLVKKTLAAARHYGVKTILLGGGVSANVELRKQFMMHNSSFIIHFAPYDLTTDNAAMIALTGATRYLAAKTINWYDVRVDPNAKLTNR